MPSLRTSSWCVYSHFEGVARWEDVARDLGARTDEHPYRCDDAALHHVLDDGWVYVLRFDNGVTSAGVLIDGYRGRPDLSLTPEQEWRRVLVRYPGLARQFEHATPVRPFVRTGIMQCRLPLAGGWDDAVLASSAYTLDALYSTGIAHTLLTIQRLARLLERHWEGDLHAALAQYNAALSREIDFVDQLVDGTYQAFRHFGLLTSFSMYYFAAAITAEERRQRGEAGENDELLHSHDPAYRAAVERGYRAVVELGRQSSPDVEGFRAFVAREIAPWNSVGLCDPRKRNLYPYG
jgi:FADH2 O2-dependent halogenase